MQSVTLSSTCRVSDPWSVTSREERSESAALFVDKSGNKFSVLNRGCTQEKDAPQRLPRFLALRSQFQSKRFVHVLFGRRNGCSQDHVVRNDGHACAPVNTLRSEMACRSVSLFWLRRDERGSLHAAQCSVTMYPSRENPTAAYLWSAVATDALKCTTSR